MISSRWRKVLRDLWQNKGRSLLVILSIAVGVLAVGTVVQMREIIQKDMVGSYEKSRPAHVVISTDEPFDDELLEVIREMPGVGAVQGLRTTVMRFQLGPDQAWYPVRLIQESAATGEELDEVMQARLDTLAHANGQAGARAENGKADTGVRPEVRHD